VDGARGTVTIPVVSGSRPRTSAATAQASARAQVSARTVTLRGGPGIVRAVRGSTSVRPGPTLAVVARATQPHPPRLVGRATPPGPHLAAEFDEVVGRAEFHEPLADPVHGVSWADAAEVEFDAVGLLANGGGVVGGRTPRVDELHANTPADVGTSGR